MMVAIVSFICHTLVILISMLRLTMTEAETTRFLKGQHPEGQTTSWDPSMQAGRPSFVSVPATFPGQTYQTAGPSYSSSGNMQGSQSLQPPGQGPSGGSPAPQIMPQYGHHSNFRPGGPPQVGQPPYYSQ
ncbi:hypothetical protein FRX31_012471 [Thalictrum thalictroides]|uniref:Uncharacterized protein n=1 Tax=Thalictrum thalictroides TaxID=46969 RepID=A0A7J6WNB4_THATH|nr:hypothetical protein FRX31_012471 [Thalictrum thalictroides]